MGRSRRGCAALLSVVLWVGCVSGEIPPSGSSDDDVGTVNDLGRGQQQDAGRVDSTGGGHSDIGQGQADTGGSGDDAGQGSEGGPPAACPGGAAAWDALVAEVQGYVDGQGGPGAALAVVCEGKLVHAAGFGLTRFGGNQPVTKTTRFQLASVTKMFTGATAVALAESGTVDLQAPVSGVLGNVSYGRASLHQLLTHTASYPTDFARISSSDLVSVVRENGGQAPWAPPGAVWNYSNPGFSVAGAVLELAAGVSFAQLVETRVFAPAGMTRATMRVSSVLAAGDYAYGHRGSAAAPSSIAPDGSYFEAGSYGPQGGAWGSVEDLAHWGEVHLEDGGAVLSKAGMESLSRFHTRTADTEKGYGYGLFITTYTEPDTWSHGGSTPGFLADWRLVPELGFGVFAVSNADWVEPGEIADLAMDRYVTLGWDGAPPAEPVLDDFVGSYVDPFELGTIRVTSAGGQLSARVGGTTRPMTHLWEDNFLLFHPELGFEIEVTFWRAAGPRAEYMVSIWGIATRR